MLRFVRSKCGQDYETEDRLVDTQRYSTATLKLGFMSLQMEMLPYWLIPNGLTVLKRFKTYNTAGDTCASRKENGRY